MVTTVPGSVVRGMEGTYPDGRHYNRVVGGHPAVCLKPDGSLLFDYRPRALLGADVRRAYDELYRAARPTNRRTVAAGTAEVFRSGVIGWLDGRPVGGGAVPPSVMPLLVGMDAEFRRGRPKEYAVLTGAAARLPPGVGIPGTPFTTVTVNRDARMAVHRDDGNLPGGYGVLTVIEAGDYDGGLLVFPEYRAAVDLRSCDVLIADNREAHGNTEFVGRGAFNRVSVVLYLHSSNLV